MSGKIFATIVTLLVFLNQHGEATKANSSWTEACHVKKLMDKSFLDVMRTSLVLRDLQVKLLASAYPGQKKLKNGCPLAPAYIDSGNKFEKFNIVQRLDFNEKVITQYINTLESVKWEEEKKSQKASFLNELNQVLNRMRIDKYRMTTRRQMLITYPCLGTDLKIKLWRRFSPVYPNPNPDPCNRNKIDEILTIVQDIRTIYQINKAWFYKEAQLNTKYQPNVLLD